MNKFLAVVLLVVVGAALAMDDKGKTEYMNKLIDECQKSEKTPVADVISLRHKNPPTSKEAKKYTNFETGQTEISGMSSWCLVGCMFEKMTIFVNGKFSKENANTVCQTMFKDNPEQLKKAMTTHQICEPIALAGGNDKCVNGPVLYDCIKKNMAEFLMFPGPEN